jgi:hypothetical protein
MSEIKRGYPNPNYTDGDILTEEEAELLADVGLVTIDADHYEELVSKAAALDILTADLKKRGSVNDEVVWAVTGADPDRGIKDALKDKDQAWSLYWKAQKRLEELEKELADAKIALQNLEREKEEDHGQD